MGIQYCDNVAERGLVYGLTVSREEYKTKLKIPM